jgi:hypothetical protein
MTKQARGSVTFSWKQDRIVSSALIMVFDYGDDTENNASLRCYGSARAHHIAAVMTGHEAIERGEHDGILWHSHACPLASL